MATFGNLLLILIGALLFGALFLVFYFISIYNGLVRRRNEYKNSFEQIDIQLKRRHDLIPNLVETAKGFLSHEKDTLEAVIAARSGAVTANQNMAGNLNNKEGMAEVMKAEAGLSGALGRLMMLNERYPELKSDKTMNSLMEEIQSTENRIAFSRQHYNDVVTNYNSEREVFPNVFIAQMFNFTEAMLWEITNKEERENVKVSFE
ncbi:MAG: hypothetical protein CME70_14860 [Halobacteriovorax sp.]|nr:hypothetical protein [Halobacteriovorax sp.]|tara:strand:+ start:159480 stop:160094 length:615 start_codon:yes stop_codon:yes gene_type:complete